MMSRHPIEPMTTARLEMIEQQITSGFCWHIHAQELLAEVQRLRHLHWHLQGMVSRETLPQSLDGA